MFEEFRSIMSSFSLTPWLLRVSSVFQKQFIFVWKPVFRPLSFTFFGILHSSFTSFIHWATTLYPRKVEDGGWFTENRWCARARARRNKFVKVMGERAGKALLYYLILFFWISTSKGTVAAEFASFPGKARWNRNYSSVLFIWKKDFFKSEMNWKDFYLATIKIPPTFAVREQYRRNYTNNNV